MMRANARGRASANATTTRHASARASVSAKGKGLRRLTRANARSGEWRRENVDVGFGERRARRAEGWGRARRGSETRAKAIDWRVFRGDRARSSLGESAGMTAEEATAMAEEASRLKEEVREWGRKLEKARQESSDAEDNATAMAEQAVLAAEGHQKNHEIEEEAMTAAEDGSRALIYAQFEVEEAIARLKGVEQAIVRAQLVPSDRAINDGKVSFIDETILKKGSSDDVATDVIASRMGLKAAPWWEVEGLTFDEAETTAVKRLKAAEAHVKECETELARRRKFANEAKSRAKVSLENSLSTYERADEAMRKVSAKMETVLELNRTITRIEQELEEKQSVINRVMFDESVVPSMARKHGEADAKEGEIFKSNQDVNDTVADKRAAAAEEQAKGGEASTSASKTVRSNFLTAGYFTSKERVNFGELVASEVLENVRKVATAMLMLGSATLILPTQPCQIARQQIGASLVRAGSKATSASNALKSKTTKLIERVVPESERKLAAHAVHEASKTGMSDVLWLLFTSVLAVQLVTKLPGGSPVLGFLLGGALVGPFGLGIITHVQQVKVLAEFGVVFLLFNIGLELSYQRLASMAKYIFGLGSAQMVISTAFGAGVAVACGLSVPAAVIIGLGLAFSSTAVALQVLSDRGESASRHGRATFSLLLFQDLTVVLVFMLIPLLAGPDSGSLTAIGSSLLKAIVKTGVAIASIIGLGRVILRPLFNRVAKLGQAELMSATTLFVALGTSLLTQSLGLSMALGAFLAGLLLAETEFHLQVENDIAPFRGLLLGLFFMTVGMTINPMTFAQNSLNIIAMMFGIVTSKIAVVAAVGPFFGLSVLNSFRSGMYIGPGGEFAFVTFAEAVRVGLFSASIATQLNLAVVLTMAMTPYLAELGSRLKDTLQSPDVASLQPKENEVDDLTGHVILAGYGRNGQIVGEILTQNLVPFVALDVKPEIVSEGRARDRNVFFGDAGSAEVLRAVGAARASCAVVSLNSPGANYRAVWSLAKNFPNVQTYVRARDVAGGLVLEKAGAKAVVPETLEPALQLAAALLREQKMPPDAITVAIDSYRRNHLKDLQGTKKLSVNYRQSQDEEFSANLL